MPPGPMHCVNCVLTLNNSVLFCEILWLKISNNKMCNLNIKIMSNSHFSLCQMSGQKQFRIFNGKKVRKEWLRTLCVPIFLVCTARTIVKNCHNTFPFWDFIFHRCLKKSCYTKCAVPYFVGEWKNRLTHILHFIVFNIMFCAPPITSNFCNKTLC